MNANAWATAVWFRTSARDGGVTDWPFDSLGFRDCYSYAAHGGVPGDSLDGYPGGAPVHGFGRDDFDPRYHYARVESGRRSFEDYWSGVARRSRAPVTRVAQARAWIAAAGVQ